MVSKKYWFQAAVEANARFKTDSESANGQLQFSLVSKNFKWSTLHGPLHGLHVIWSMWYVTHIFHVKWTMWYGLCRLRYKWCILYLQNGIIHFEVSMLYFSIYMAYIIWTILYGPYYMVYITWFIASKRHIWNRLLL